MGRHWPPPRKGTWEAFDDCRLLYLKTKTTLTLAILCGSLMLSNLCRIACYLFNFLQTSVSKEGDTEELKMEVERLRRENREEKEKVINLNTWKEQLKEKNKQLKEQNNK